MKKKSKKCTKRKNYNLELQRISRGSHDCTLKGFSEYVRKRGAANIHKVKSTSRKGAHEYMYEQEGGGGGGKLTACPRPADKTLPIYKASTLSLIRFALAKAVDTMIAPNQNNNNNNNNNNTKHIKPE